MKEHKKWDIIKKTNTGIMFDLKAGNSEIIATGEGYKAKRGCLNSIESIQKYDDSEVVEAE